MSNHEKNRSRNSEEKAKTHPKRYVTEDTTKRPRRKHNEKQKDQSKQKDNFNPMPESFDNASFFVNSFCSTSNNGSDPITYNKRYRYRSKPGDDPDSESDSSDGESSIAAEDIRKSINEKISQIRSNFTTNSNFRPFNHHNVPRPNIDFHCPFDRNCLFNRANNGFMDGTDFTFGCRDNFRF